MKTAMVMIVCGASLAGCASLPGGAADVAPDKSGIVILRTEGLNGAVLMDVQIDGTPISGPTGRSYLYREVAPGRHTVTATAQNKARIEVDVKPGQPLYIKQQASSGFNFAVTRLVPLSDQEGQRLARGRH